MSVQRSITVRAIAEDGLPDMERLVGKVAFIWDGYIVSGWPITDDDGSLADQYGLDDGEVPWEPASDSLGGPKAGVTHWIEFDRAGWTLTK